MLLSLFPKSNYMKNIFILLPFILLVSCSKKTDNPIPATSKTTLAPTIYTIYFEKSDSLFYPNPPNGDTLFLDLSDKNFVLGSKVIVEARLNKGQTINFICHDFAIENLPYIPLTANRNANFIITICPLGVSHLAGNPDIYFTFVSCLDAGN